MDHHSLIVITGMTGVGKSYLADRAAALSGHSVINLGTVIGEILGAHRDVMMKTTQPAAIRAAQIAACQTAVARQPAYVTAHTVRDYEGAQRYDIRLERILQPRCYVFVMAAPAVIAARTTTRNKAGERQSPLLTHEEIEQNQYKKQQALETLTNTLGCPLITLINDEVSTEKNVQHLASLWSSLVY